MNRYCGTVPKRCSTLCGLCGMKKAHWICGSCKCIRYCSEKHQKLHWELHKPVCKCHRTHPEYFTAAETGDYCGDDSNVSVLKERTSLKMEARKDMKPEGVMERQKTFMDKQRERSRLAERMIAMHGQPPAPQEMLKMLQEIDNDTLLLYGDGKSATDILTARHAAVSDGMQKAVALMRFYLGNLLSAMGVSDAQIEQIIILENTADIALRTYLIQLASGGGSALDQLRIYLEATSRVRDALVLHVYNWINICSEQKLASPEILAWTALNFSGDASKKATADAIGTLISGGEYPTTTERFNAEEFMQKARGLLQKAAQIFPSVPTTTVSSQHSAYDSDDGVGVQHTDKTAVTEAAVESKFAKWIRPQSPKELARADLPLITSEAEISAYQFRAAMKNFVDAYDLAKQRSDETKDPGYMGQADAVAHSLCDAMSAGPSNVSSGKLLRISAAVLVGTIIGVSSATLLHKYCSIKADDFLDEVKSKATVLNTFIAKSEESIKSTMEQIKEVRGQLGTVIEEYTPGLKSNVEKLAILNSKMVELRNKYEDHLDQAAMYTCMEDADKRNTKECGEFTAAYLVKKEEEQVSMQSTRTCSSGSAGEQSACIADRENAKRAHEAILGRYTAIKEQRLYASPNASIADSVKLEMQRAMHGESTAQLMKVLEEQSKLANQIGTEMDKMKGSMEMFGTSLGKAFDLTTSQQSELDSALKQLAPTKEGLGELVTKMDNFIKSAGDQTTVDYIAGLIEQQPGMRSMGNWVRMRFSTVKAVENMAYAVKKDMEATRGMTAMGSVASKTIMLATCTATLVSASRSGMHALSVVSIAAPTLKASGVKIKTFGAHLEHKESEESMEELKKDAMVVTKLAQKLLSGEKVADDQYEAALASNKRLFTHIERVNGGASVPAWFVGISMYGIGSLMQGSGEFLDMMAVPLKAGVAVRGAAESIKWGSQAAAVVAEMTGLANGQRVVSAVSSLGGGSVGTVVQHLTSPIVLNTESLISLSESIKNVCTYVGTVWSEMSWTRVAAGGATGVVLATGVGIGLWWVSRNSNYGKAISSIYHSTRMVPLVTLTTMDVVLALSTASFLGWAAPAAATFVAGATLGPWIGGAIVAGYVLYQMKGITGRMLDARRKANLGGELLKSLGKGPSESVSAHFGFVGDDVEMSQRKKAPSLMGIISPVLYVTPDGMQVTWDDCVTVACALRQFMLEDTATAQLELGTKSTRIAEEYTRGFVSRALASDPFDVLMSKLHYGVYTI